MNHEAEAIVRKYGGVKNRKAYIYIYKADIPATFKFKLCLLAFEGENKKR